MASPPVLAPTTEQEDQGTTQTIGKRKRTPEIAATPNEQLNGGLVKLDPQSSESFQSLLEDIILVLGEYDTTPSILEHALDPTIKENHDAKRIKLRDADDTPSVSSLVQSSAYTDMDSFYKDLKTAISLASAQEPGPKKSKLTRFESELDQIIQYEIGNSEFPIPRAAEGDRIPIVKQEFSSSLSTDPDLVLTTTGIAHGSVYPAKRLYSSLRLSASALAKGRKALAALELDRLPHGITAASIRTEKSSSEVDKKAPTLSELYPTSKHLRFFEPPRPSSQAATRGQTISWSQAEFNPKPVRPNARGSFYNQPLSSGQWLSYNASPSVSQLPSTSEKRKQRDRALSTGEANAELTEEEQEEIRVLRDARQRAKDEALFKSTYSSFAPTHDNTAAVVPQQLKSRLWWDKYGYAKPLHYFTDYERSNEEDEMWKSSEVEADEEDKRFEEMVNSWEDIDTVPPDLKTLDGTEKEVDKKDKDVDEILQEVSDMLETLSSYQRNRNLSPAKQQGSTTQSKSVAELTGDTSHPSNAESILYETLKSQLTVIVASLPPYAVAKLDGEKLGELNVSTKTVVRAPLHQGTLSKPEPPKIAQASVAASTPSVRPQTNVAPRTPSYQQPTNTPANRITSTLGRSSSGSSHPTTTLRQPSTTTTTATTNYNTAYLPQQVKQPPQRVSYSQYGQSTPSANNNQLSNGTRPMTNGYSTYSHQPTSSTGSPGAARTTPVQQPPQVNYQQRSESTATPQTYSNYNINMHRANYSTPGVGAGRPSWYPSNGTIGSMFSAEEVQTLENRQKLQMAAQHAQLRQGSGTPQPPRPASVQSNGGHSNGTPVAQQPNGEV